MTLSLSLFPCAWLAPSERFGRILVDTVGTDKMKSWVKVNRGAMVLCRSVMQHCYLKVEARKDVYMWFLSVCLCVCLCVCSLLNSCDKSVASEVKEALKSITSELSSISNNKGAEILLENLNK